MRPIRVMYFASTSDKSGGSLHSLADLTFFLRQRGLVEPLIVLPGHGSGEAMINNMGVDYVVLQSFGSEWPLGSKKPFRQRMSHLRQRLINQKAIHGACRLAKKLRVDLIHINTSVNEIGYYVAKKTHTPFVWHIREFINEGLGLEFYNEKRVYRHMKSANLLVAVSSSLRERYEGLLHPKKIELIPNGINPSGFRVAQEKEYGGTLNIAMVGRVSRLKGHYDVIDALSVAKLKDYRLMLIGEEDATIAEYASKMGVLDHIVFAGYQDDIVRYLEDSHILIAAHPWEAFGRSTVEAMMAGCMIIGVDNGGTKDLVQNGVSGALYSLGDIEGLAKQIVFFNFHRDELKKRALEGKSRALSHFTLECTASHIFSCYERVIKK